MLGLQLIRLRPRPVLVRKDVKGDFLAPFVVYCLFHFIYDVTAFVQNEADVVQILAVLRLSVDDFLVAHASGLLVVAAVLLKAMPRVYMPRFMLWPLYIELLRDRAAEVRCDDDLEIWFHLLPALISDCIRRHRVGAAECPW